MNKVNKQFNYKSILSVGACVAALAACGGNDTSTESLNTQSKQLTRNEKTVASDYAIVVEQLYVAYFGRPADPTGLTNFENALLAANAPTTIQGLSAVYSTNTTIKSLIDSFGASAESQALYGNGTTTAFVNAIYQNVLNRTPQASGLNFWVNAIATGTLSQGDAALSIMAGAMTNNSAQGLLDTALVNNRLAAATYFTSQIGSQNASSVYTGASAAAAARAILAAITASTSYSSLSATVTSDVSKLVCQNGYTGVFNGTSSGTYPGTVQVVLTAASGSTYNVTGTVSAAGFTIPVVGTTQPPSFNAQFSCGGSSVCGNFSGTISSTGITGSYSFPGAGSGQVSLTKVCS